MNNVILNTPFSSMEIEKIRNYVQKNIAKNIKVNSTNNLNHNMDIGTYMSITGVVISIVALYYQIKDSNQQNTINAKDIIELNKKLNFQEPKFVNVEKKIIEVEINDDFYKISHSKQNSDIVINITNNY